MSTDNSRRARIAYDSFRSGFEHGGIVPHWDDAPTWVRDAVIVAYLQGMLDAEREAEGQRGMETLATMDGFHNGPRR